jgi:hypothetical protein
MQVKALKEPPQLGRETCMPSIMVTDNHLPLLGRWLLIRTSILWIRVLRVWMVIWITYLFLLFSWLLFLFLLFSWLLFWLII